MEGKKNIGSNDWIRRLTFPLRRGYYSLINRIPKAGKQIVRKSGVQQFGDPPDDWNVIKDLLGPESIVYSCGVGEDISFDLALYSATDCRIFLFDPTPVANKFVSEVELPPNIKLKSIGIAGYDGSMGFERNSENSACFRQVQGGEKQLSFDVKRLTSIMEELGHREIDLLKLDIEGCEYDVLADMLESNIFPRQILVEFHHRFFPKDGIQKTNDMVRKLNRLGYSSYFVSKYRQEFSFLKI